MSIPQWFRGLEKRLTDLAASLAALQAQVDAGGLFRTHAIGNGATYIVARVGIGMAVHLPVPNVRVHFLDVVSHIRVPPVNPVARYAIRIAGAPTWTSYTDPEQAFVTFGCVDLGTQPVQVGVFDSGSNLLDYVETFVTVQDNTGACA